MAEPTLRWFVTGAEGMLGTDLVEALRSRGEQVTAAGRDLLDITDAAACAEAVAGHDVVVGCAAYTAVDPAESAEERALAVNGAGAGNLARAAAATGARLVHISTDYVFDGQATEPYAVSAPVAPLQAYGRTKLAGEQAVARECPQSWVVRTAWLYGAHGDSFPSTIARLGRERGQVSVVTDEVGQPTWTVDLADAILQLVTARAPFGLWHATGGGQCSRFEFARAVFEEIGLDPNLVLPTSSAAFARPARRPAYSVLSHARWAECGLSAPRHWRAALAEAAPSVLR
ncbi:MAG: dTDP-4-dehydrorhamnose reductase [Tetrasphaera sp.]|nr:dTDP-4-dehydrorhamnose reductase [Tetrasphaera sp.]